MTQTASYHRISFSFYHFVCLQFLGLILSQAGVEGEQDRWVVYQLAPLAADNVTRLAVNLSTVLHPDAPTSASSFTLCLWFKVVSFRDLSCLLSYALSAENDGAITIFVRPSGVEVSYGKISVRHGLAVRPLWWYPMCVVVTTYTLAVWVAGKEQLLNRSVPELPLNGFLVLGQEQDDLDSGFDSNQAFDGHVTGLTLWPHALTSHQLQVWAACEATHGVEAYLTWDNIIWAIHNDTGGVKSHFDGPCHQNETGRAKLMLFTNKMSWFKAQKFLQHIGLRMISPYSMEERQQVADLLQKYIAECTNAYSEGAQVWLDFYENEINSTLRDEDSTDMTHSINYKISQDEKGILRREDPSEQLCFVGQYRNVPEEIRLRGLCEVESSQNWSFIITSTGSEDHESSIYLHGYGDYYIAQNSSSWCLRYSRDQFIACSTSSDLPLGRHLWRLKNNPCKKRSRSAVQLSLSTCASEYFTCQDSTCIHLSRLCNNVRDCQDGADEEDCFTCIKPAGYVLAIPPVVPVQLMVTAIVSRIGSTNLLTSTIELDVTLVVAWTDHRLEFRHLHNSTGTPAIVENDSKVWMPTFKVERGSLTQREKENALEIQKKTNGTVVDGAHIAYSGAENQLMMIMDLDIVSHCHFDLKRYPWDVQECDVNLQIMKLFKSQVEVLEDSLVRSCPKRLVEYDIRACDLKAAEGGFVIKLVMERCSDFHIWTTYLPTSLLQGIGYGTLFLPVERFPERGTMSLTTLLVFISLYTDVSSSLPNTSYVKYIDVWFVYNIVFLSLIIATHLLACGSIQGTEVGPWITPKGDASKGSTNCNKRENFILKVTRTAFGVATFLFLIGYFIATMY